MLMKLGINDKQIVKYFCQAWHFGKDRETRLFVLIPEMSDLGDVKVPSG